MVAHGQRYVRDVVARAQQLERRQQAVLLSPAPEAQARLGEEATRQCARCGGQRGGPALQRAIVGGVLVAYLPERFRGLSDWRLLIFGVALMVIVVWRPQGLLPPVRTRRAVKAKAEIESLEGAGVDD